jgi:predicted ribonuclease toxin of YeeF-YezG toxin-antitoxin module
MLEIKRLLSEIRSIIRENSKFAACMKEIEKAIEHLRKAKDLALKEKDLISKLQSLNVIAYSKKIT